MLLAFSTVSSAHQARSSTSSSPTCSHSRALSSSPEAFVLSVGTGAHANGNPTASPWSLDSPAFLEDHCTSSSSSDRQHPLPHHSALRTSLPVPRENRSSCKKPPQTLPSPSICVLLLTCPSSHHGPNPQFTPSATHGHHWSSCS